MSILKLQKLPSICLLFEIQSALLSLWPWFLCISTDCAVAIALFLISSFLLARLFFSFNFAFLLQCFFVFHFICRRSFFVCRFFCEKKKQNDISMLLSCMIIVTFLLANRNEKKIIQIEKSINFHLSELFVLLAKINPSIETTAVRNDFVDYAMKIVLNMCMLSDRKRMIKAYYRCSLDCFRHLF